MKIVLTNKESNMFETSILILIVLVALSAAFIILLLKKLGFVEWMQVHGDKITSQLFGCDFCMSFWTAMLLCAVICAFNDDARMMIVPLFSTPLTRYLL